MHWKGLQVRVQKLEQLDKQIKKFYTYLKGPALRRNWTNGCDLWVVTMSRVYCSWKVAWIKISQRWVKACWASNIADYQSKPIHWKIGECGPVWIPWRMPGICHNGNIRFSIIFYFFRPILLVYFKNFVFFVKLKKLHILKTVT